MLLAKLVDKMNAALVIEEPLETIRIMPAPSIELRLAVDFSSESFEVPILSNAVVASSRSLSPDCATPVTFNLLLTCRLTATQTISVRKLLKP